jgi:hypothetical protein
VPAERCSIEEQSIVECGWAWCVLCRGARCSEIATPTHNILSTAPELSISQKALGTLPEYGNVMPKRVGATTHN